MSFDTRRPHLFGLTATLERVMMPRMKESMLRAKVGRCRECKGQDHRLHRGVFLCDACSHTLEKRQANMMAVNEIRFALLNLGVKWS